MAFSEQREQLRHARLQRENNERERFKLREKLKKTRREQARLARFETGQGGVAERLRELQRREAELAREIDNLNEVLGRNNQLEFERFREFLTFTDPREHLSQLDDKYPILLFPLRIETRFKMTNVEDGTLQHQLWVRVFPDEAAIDTFEELLSENEVRNARSYWQSRWQAGGVEDGERAAWRALVSSHGSGRAHWIQQHYRPLNETEQPVKTNATDVILVIATDQPPPESERSAIAQYWQALWRAQEDRDRQQLAWDDLVAAVGEPRAREIHEQYVPVNFSVKPQASQTYDSVPLQLSFLVFPTEDMIDTKFQSWSQAPKVHLLPERFVLLGFSGSNEIPAIQALGAPIPSSLATGPDPSSGADSQMRVENGELVVSDEMNWMVDFDQAVAKGMGFKINLTPEQASRGFDRLMVLGVRLSLAPANGKQALESLIDHHHHSRKGFSLLPQGTPTNNTEKRSSGYSWREDSDVSFNQYFKGEDSDDPLDWFGKRDGRWLAEMLGIDAAVLKPVAHYSGQDQRDAKAMNTALWPATLGYFMQTMMTPVFSERVIEQTRQFFRRYVSGRGAIPAIRVGKQPYGILPVTPFSRLRWMRVQPPLTHLAANADLSDTLGYLHGLYSILRNMDGDWSSLLEDVPHVGKPGGDPHQTLLDIIGLHPTSVDFAYRHAQSFSQLYNSLNLKGLGRALVAILIAAGYVKSGMDLLGEFGYRGEGEEETPDILRKFFFGQSDPLNGPMIDDVPVSETDPLRVSTLDGNNYIQWLITAANTSHDSLRRQRGFIDDKPPRALLYLMLHHALDLSYLDTSLRLHAIAGVYNPDELIAARKEPDFIHVREASKTPESRWHHLYKTETRITARPDLLIADYIPQIIDEASEADVLREQLQALAHLQNAPTAQLERAFFEHLDLCSYRLDAWKLGLVNYQLEMMRGISEQGDDERPPEQGLYIGAYGWLEDVRSEQKVLRPAHLDADLEEIFADSEHPLMVDDQNGGYIHAPSVNHAVTAAVLRNGYLANRTEGTDSTLEINLSSQRVRKALTLVEGIRAGQSLAALLGYQLERGLHDRHDVEVDSVIYDLRIAFPLAANQLSSTQTDEFDSIEQIEARNVVDGLKLLEQIKSSGTRTYPFGRSGLPDLTTEQRDAVNQEVEKILDMNDAVADLALAESVHQVVQGNYDRAAATMDAFSKGHFPPIPDVVRTPRSGVTLTHRVGLHFATGLDSADPVNSTPRAQAEPGVNQWLANLLPTLADVVCVVEFFDHATAAMREETIALQDVGMAPIDVLYRVDLEGEQAMTALDDAIVWHVSQTFSPRPDAEIKIQYTRTVSGKYSLFEITPLLASLRGLIQRSRPLTAADVKLSNEAKKADEADVSLNPSRVVLPRDRLASIEAQLAAYIAALDPVVSAEDVATMTANVDQYVADLASIFHALAQFGLPQTGIGFLLDWRRQQFALLMNKLSETIGRWEDKLAAFDALIAEYEALPASESDETRFATLSKAERLISTQATVALPPTPNDFRDTLVNTKRLAFAAKLDGIKAIRSEHTLSGLYTGIAAVTVDIGDYELIGIDISAERKQLAVFVDDVLTGAKNVQADLAKRLAQIAGHLSDHDAAGRPQAQVDALLAAAKVLFGEEFRLVPEFGLGADQAAEWQSAYDHRDQLLDYQLNTKNEPFPVDGWLYGVARVREKLGYVENATLMAEAFGRNGISLEPIQFPSRAQDHWLGLEYPSTTAAGEAFVIDEDKLLYTAHYATAFNGGSRQGGLLLDEWTEVIPTPEETTGLTFHYDRPNAEPPQTLLLATPAEFRGSWQWLDLVDSLHEALDMAKKRAIEPDHVATTDYARFLPALISSETLYAITPSLNLALNNKFYRFGSVSDE